MRSTPLSDPFKTVSLDDFAPSAPARKPEVVTERMVSNVAQDHGFVINNLEEKPIPALRRSAIQKKMISKTLRIQLSDLNKFQQWCNDNGYSHWEGFASLVASLPGVRS